MNALDRLAEERLARAIADGLFADVAGLGQPLELEDLSSVPEDLRAGYLLLKGAHVLPEEMELRRSLVTLANLLSACQDDEGRRTLEARRRDTLLRHEILMERRRDGLRRRR